MEKSKYPRTVTVRGCSGTTNTVVTQKQENPLKVIWNLVPNIIQSQWPKGLTVPT